MKKSVIALVSSTALISVAPALAVDSCGGQTSPFNPEVCCDAAGNAGGTYGNCVWWTWKKGFDQGWPIATMPTTAARTWDNAAANYPKLFTIYGNNVSADFTGSIAVKESSPYVVNGVTYDYGHVAYITGMKLDARGVPTGVLTTEMNCGKFGVKNAERSLSFFDKYIKIKPLDGTTAVASGCSADAVVAASSGTTSKLSLMWSKACQTYWATVSSTLSGYRSVSIRRAWDNRTYTGTSPAPLNATSPMVIANGIQEMSGKYCANAAVGGIPLPSVCK